MVSMRYTTLFLTLAVFFNAVLVDSYDTGVQRVKVSTTPGYPGYLQGQIYQSYSSWNQLIGSKLIVICPYEQFVDCKIRTQRLCSKSRLIVIFKPSLYSNYKNHVTLKFYPADENGQEFQVVPLYPEFNNDDSEDYTVEHTETIHDAAMSMTVTIGIIVALIVGGIIVITLIICCCCCRGGRSGGHVYRSTPVTTTTTTVITQQRNQPPQYPAQAPGGYPGYQATSPAPPAAQMAPPHQGTSPGYPPQNMASGYPLQNQGSKVEPSAPPPPSAPYMQDMPYYPPPQDQSYPPPQNQPYPLQPYGGMVQPPPYSEK